MPVIVITLKTLQPLLATSFQGDPNSDVSYDYIPGSMIRGALISRYLKHKQQTELDLDNPEVQRLFFDSENTRYLNAYLVGKQENHRTLPVPRSWYKEKEDELTDDLSISIYDLSIEQDEKSGSIKSINGHFCTFEDGYIRLYKPDRRINIHNQRDRRKGRSSKQEDQPNSEGEIFRYDALDANQTFQTAILCGEQDVSIFKELLTQKDLWLGGSRSAGYGHTQFSYEVQENWQEAKLSEDDDLGSGYLTVTLLSDTLLNNTDGHPTADPALIQTTINATFGSSLPVPQPKFVFGGSTLIGGFNRKWGLPLPQVPALAAGTVILFEDTALTEDQIQKLQWQGIGNRRNEGFGRVAVNWHRQESFQAKKPPKVFDRNKLPEISSTKLAEFMAQRLLRQRLEQKLKQEINICKLKQDAEGRLPISNSQLSRLGVAVHKGLAITSFDPVRNFLDSKNLTKTALQQFQAARIDKNNKSLNEQIETWLNNPHSWLNLPDRDLDITLGFNINRSIDAIQPYDPLLIEYTLKLIMAVAKQATKES